MFSQTFFRIAMQTPDTLVNTRKLDVALRLTDVALLKEDLLLQRPTLRSRCLTIHHTPDELLRSTTSSSLLPLILSDILNTPEHNNTSRGNILPQVFKLVNENMEVQHYHLSSSMFLNSDEYTHKHFRTWIQKCGSIPDIIQRLFIWEHELGEAVERHGSLQYRLRDKRIRNSDKSLKNLTTHRCNDIDLTMAWSKTVILFIYKKNYWLLPAEYLLLLHNKICDFISSILLIQAAEGSCYEEGALSIVLELVDELSGLAYRYRKFFDIVKALEGIVIGEVLMTEESWKNTDLITSISSELETIGYIYNGSRLQEIIQSASTPLKHELAGLAKLCGHPFIDLPETAEAAKTRARIQPSVNYFAIQTTRNMAVESFIRNYIARHGKWPPVTIEADAPLYLRESNNLNRDPKSAFIIRRFGLGSHDDYVYVELGRVIELDKLEHYSQYLKDKALSVLRNTAEGYYINHTVERLEWKETRLLLVHMLHSEEELDVRNYLKQYCDSEMNMEDILNYLTIKLVPKEKELKEIGRPFGCKTYMDRFRSCLQEENVKHFLDLYSTDQSMTLDNLGLIKRLYSFRTLNKTYKNWRVLYINFDVSGWCANFRHETVEPIGTDVLDRVFGTSSLFGKTQRAYEKGFFYIPDSQGTYHWEGQDGGIEGLNQYTWMTVYIPQMRFALEAFKMHFFVMAYGDDYKAALLIPPEEKNIDIEELKKKIVTSVADTARIEFGQKMKYFDSYGSEVYISFCKNASVSAVGMPQGIRKIQKCYGSTNAFLPTLDDYVASAFSNAHSAACAMTNTYPAYRVSLTWLYYHLKTHMNYCDLTDTELHATALTPSCVGGLPILFLANFHTRAENDHLPFYLDLIKFLKTYNPQLAGALSQGLTFELLGIHEIEALLRDPYSLPVKKPQLPSGVLRRELLPALKPIIRNQEILTLIEASDEEWTRNVISCLTSGDILYPRVFSSIYSCTPKAMMEEMMKRFETSASVKEILVMRQGVRRTTQVLRRVLKAEIALQEWRSKRVKLTGYGEYWRDMECPAQYADYLRGLWGKPVSGVTMPPMTHLIILVDSYMGAIDPHARMNHFTYHLLNSNPVIKHYPSQHWELGDASPFLGHKTRLGSELPQIKIIEDNPFLSKIKTLLDIVTWVDKGGVDAVGNPYRSNLVDLILVIISLYYKGDPTDLLALGAKRKSGTMKHHWRSPHYSEHIMPNTLYNTYTWVVGESNTHRHLRGSVDHYSLNFLQVFCHVVHLLQLSLEVTKQNPKIVDTWAVTRDCPFCLTPIVEPPILVDKNRIPTVQSHPVDTLEITYYSRSILGAAATQLHARPLKQNLNMNSLPVDMAVMGVIQRLSEQTHIRANQMADRVGLLHKTYHDIQLMETWLPGGFGVTVREREIRHSPRRILCECVLQIIYSHIIQMGPRHQAQTMMARLFLENPKDLPWVSLVEMIHQAGRLTELILECKIMTGILPPVCYQNPLSAARYLGDAALLSDTESLFPFRFAWLSYYEDEEKERYLLRITRIIKRRIIWKVLRPQIVALLRVDKSPDHHIDLLLACLLLASAPTVPVQVVELALKDTKDNLVVLSPVQVEHVTLDDIRDSLDDPESIATEVMTMVKRLNRYPTISRGNIEEQYDDHYDGAYEHIMGELERMGKCRILDATLADCINTIREQTPEQVPYRSDKGTSLGGISFLPGTPNFSPSHHVKIINERSPVVELMKLPEINYLVPELVNVLSPHHLYRPYSRGISTTNKLLEIFAYSHIDTKSLTNINCMCLGEGFGGMLDTIATLGRNSHFVYNTLPPSDRYDTLPGIALQTLNTRGHTLDESLVNTSVYDLSQPETAYALCTNDKWLYHLFTNDAEANWCDTHNYGNLLKNVGTIFLTKRSPTGILICKIMLDALRVTGEFISRICHYCNYVHIVKLDSSPPGGECYVIAHGVSRVYDGLESHSLLNPVVGRRLTVLAENLKKKYISMWPPRDTTLSFQKPQIFKYFSQFKRCFPAGWQHRIMGRHGIPIKLTDNDWSTSRALSSGVYRELRKSLHVITCLYKDLEDTVTAAGVTNAAMRLLLMSSLTHYFNTVLIHNHREITHSQIRRDYTQALEITRPRVTIDDRADKYHNQIIINGIECSPWGHWLEGLACVMIYLGWTWTQ
ncbi:L protein [Guangdong red-banded snake chuvirus-like virus]|uniref:RNA-directed RNA polymerase n=1 Tax=Guangdong red-banded snake chuvirus-like virus TaxID=2116490 RepID=A0A2P1GMQ7_9VIRU|nr:L protein [Guangdong red-banded snake chuvirus-like virus]AVM87272.1 L protein [Guangdong red-banded snake chuvirus-like virus]